MWLKSESSGADIDWCTGRCDKDCGLLKKVKSGSGIYQTSVITQTNE